MHMSTEKVSKKKEAKAAKAKKASIAVPSEVTVSINGNVIETKGGLGANKREFNDALIKVSSSGRSIEIEPVGKGSLAKKSAMTVNSFCKELSNDMNGVVTPFEKHMRIVFAHFPITVESKDGFVYIKNIIGERMPRKSPIVGGTKIEVKGQNVRVYGTSLDDVAQTAANIRKTCRIRNKDSRVFQDGLYYEIM